MNKVLGIVTDCVHVFSKPGTAGSAVHIFVHQMNELAKHFEKVIICCPFEINSPSLITSYQQKNIEFIQLPNVGGDKLIDKLKLLKTIPKWLKAFRQLNQKVDIVYQRFPNNLNIPGFFYFWMKHTKVFATYTGVWDNSVKQPATYKFQKWLLKNYFRGPVGVYEVANSDQTKIFSTFSPSYSYAYWENIEEQIQSKIENLKNQLQPKLLNLITVGALNHNKNQFYILETCRLLQQSQIPFQLIVAGDGILRSEMEDFISKHDLSEHIKLVGHVSTEQLQTLMLKADMVVQAAISEGFGKVPIEGFFHGLIPVLNQTPFAQHFTNHQKGFVFNHQLKDSLFVILKNWWLTYDVATHIDMIQKGRAFARQYTLENWAEQYINKVNQYYATK